MKIFSTVRVFLLSAVFTVALGILALLAIIAADMRLGVPPQLGMPAVCFGLFGVFAVTFLMRDRPRFRNPAGYLSDRAASPRSQGVVLESAILLAPLRSNAAAGTPRMPALRRAAR